MRFSVMYPLMSHPHEAELVTAESVARVAVAAEDAGFDAIGFTDHPAPPTRWLEAGGHDALDPLVALAYVAAHTSSIRLIPKLVVLPYRNPFLLAKAGATLDILSAGRFTLAVGVGYLGPEFRALGIDRDERGELMDEGLAALKAIWTGDEVHLTGRHFEATGITSLPRPVTNPRPPIWIGGNGAAARRRVVEHADGWCPFPVPPAAAKATGGVPMDLELLADAVVDLHRRLEDADRDPRTVDVAFSVPAPYARGDADIDAILEKVAVMEAIGVTWANLATPQGPLDHVLEVIDLYADRVLDGPASRSA